MTLQEYYRKRRETSKRTNLFDRRVGYVYGLFDPETGFLMYIGQTVHHLLSRLSGHLGERGGDGPSARHHWINTLYERGLAPDIRPLARLRKRSKGKRPGKGPWLLHGEDFTSLYALESAYIQVARRLHFPLTNGVQTCPERGDSDRKLLRKIEKQLKKLPGCGKDKTDWRRQALAAGWRPPEEESQLAA